MAEPHLDHPDDVHWFSGYGPATVLGDCPHTACEHRGQSVIAWGPDLDHYELVECDMDCDSTCRAWINGRCATTTPWLHVDVPPGLEHAAPAAQMTGCGG